MATIERDQPLVPSLLYRLIDDAPPERMSAEEATSTLRTEASSLSRRGIRRVPDQQRYVLDDLKKDVRRDLESLLNTRRSALTWPSSYKHLDRSLVAFGIPDLAGANLTSREACHAYGRSMQEALTQFEPRFSRVKVTLVDEGELDGHVRFRIEATLRAEPVPVSMVFDSTMEPVTRSFDVKELDSE